MKINKQGLKDSLLEIGGAIILGFFLWLILTLFGVFK